MSKGILSASKQLGIRKKAAKQSLRSMPKGIAPKSKRSGTKIQTAMGHTAPNLLGFTINSPYSVTKPLNTGLGKLAKGKVPKAKGYR